MERIRAQRLRIIEGRFQSYGDYDADESALTSCKGSPLEQLGAECRSICPITDSYGPNPVLQYFVKIKICWCVSGFDGGGGP